MGLISKIEDKLSGAGKSEGLSKLEKSGTDSGSNSAASRLQHPVGSATNTHGTSAANRMPGSYETGAVDRDGYGTKSAGNQGEYSGQTGKYANTTDRVATSGATSAGRQGEYSGQSGSYGDTTDRVAGSGTQPSASAYGAGSREPYDPYSSQGQRSATNAAQGGALPGSVQAQDYGRRSAEDPEVMRSRHGGIKNRMEDQGYSSGQNRDAIPTAGGEKLGSSGANFSDPGATSQHHYGRDAALVGGAGATGAGAYEMSKHHHGRHEPGMTGQAYGDPSADSRYQSTGQMGQTSGESGATSRYQPTGQQSGAGMASYLPDASHSNTSSGLTRAEAEGRRSVESSTMSTGSGTAKGEIPGLSQAKKMGGAYEAGYRDAMEHMKAEMNK